MAVYKVIQDIEAEDKLLGPLTLKGFIYALTAGALAFLNFKILVTSGLGNFRWPLLLVFGLPMLLFGVLASPLGREQPTEIWLLSRVRFLVKPRRRIWNQAGISDLVTITAPKKVEKHLTKELSQTEVQSRLKTLASTMDSRGWAVKNVNINLNPIPGYLQEAGESDRLVGASSIPQQVPAVDVRPADDILDEQNNPIAQLFAGLMKKKDSERKEQVSEKLDAIRSAASPSKLTPKKQDRKGQPDRVPATGRPITHGLPAYHLAEDEAELNKKFAKAEAAFRSEHPGPKNRAKTGSDTVTAESRAAKLELAQSGNDLSVASIEKLANREPKAKQVGPNEVEISLH